MLGPEPLILVPTLRDELLRPRNRRQRTPRLLEQFQLARRERPLLIDTVDFDPMRRARNMQAPIPRGPDAQRLSIERVVPRTADDLDPAFDVAGEVHLPGTPAPAALRGEVLEWDGIPAEAAVGGEFDAFGPASPA